MEIEVVNENNIVHLKELSPGDVFCMDWGYYIKTNKTGGGPLNPACICVQLKCGIVIEIYEGVFVRKVPHAKLIADWNI